ncbi:glycosyltransferase family 29 protein [Rhizobium aegyptiacum]|uniref:glycosyltransferase family 29 protein n=1 Tax=Rhizobium aegyptiacum TaxID=1764550 RepID=UPI0007E5BC63|nr:glycosyltransferase family 29 protein [Rhizobium aegyptiacum]
MIVGNGSVDRQHVAAIDAADLVVRFNDCRSTSTSGMRTDVVAVCNTGRPARSMLGSDTWSMHPAVAAASEIWCVRDPKRFAAMKRLLAVVHPELDDFCDDGTQGFEQFCCLSGKRCLVISEATHDRVDDALREFNPAPYIVPSSGMIVIASVLDMFATDEITIAGFGHQGWEHHPFAAERRLVDHYVAQGRLSRLS